MELHNVSAGVLSNEGKVVSRRFSFRRTPLRVIRLLAPPFSLIYHVTCMCRNDNPHKYHIHTARLSPCMFPIYFRYLFFFFYFIFFFSCLPSLLLPNIYKILVMKAITDTVFTTVSGTLSVSMCSRLCPSRVNSLILSTTQQGR